jgi:hypothetical protein
MRPGRASVPWASAASSPLACERMRMLCEREPFASEPLDTRAGRRQVPGRTFEGRAPYQAVVTKERMTVRVFVVVLIGLVVVLAVLTEVCLFQAAALRRKVRAVLPPGDEPEEGR